MKGNWFTAVGLVALVAANPAAAAGEAAPGAIWSWSGFYIGVHGGFGWGRDPFTQETSGPTLTGQDSHGWLGGLQVGANWQTGAWVGGLEMDLSAAGIRGSSAFSGTDSAPAPAVTNWTASYADRFDWLGSARARLGYLPWPGLLVYVTGGAGLEPARAIFR